MKHLILAAVAISGAVAFQSPAHAVVFNPYNSPGSTQRVSTVTPGYVASWWITKPIEEDEAEDNFPGQAPASSIWPIGESPAAIKAFVQSPAILGHQITNSGCREGLGGLSGTNKKCAGNLFAIKVEDLGYLVFMYNQILNLRQFVITMDRRSQDLARMDVFTFKPTQVHPVPLPGSLPLLMAVIAATRLVAKRSYKRLS